MKFQIIIFHSLVVFLSIRESILKSTTPEPIPTDYCSITCNGEEHTMCKYKNVSPSCQDFAITFRKSARRNVLSFHNGYRNMFAEGRLNNQTLPKAANMRLMGWNNELSAIALRWLSQCITGSDKCRNLQDVEVGQNIGFISGFNMHSEFDSKFLMQHWKGQMKDITEDEVRSFKEKKENISEFSQFFWATTFQLGCSEVTYKVDNDTKKAFACNYAPKGNIVGKSMYEMGSPGASCPQGTTRGFDPNYQSLCGRKEEILPWDNDPDDSDDNESPSKESSGHGTVIRLTAWLLLIVHLIHGINLSLRSFHTVQIYSRH